MSERALQIYVPGSNDMRTFMVQGHVFHVGRSPRTLEFGFSGGGRDGDYLGDDAPQYPIIQAMIAGLPGVRHVYGPTYSAESPGALEAVERKLYEAAKRGYCAVSRSGDGTRDMAAALLALPLVPGMRRSVQIRSAHTLHIDVPASGEAQAYEWKRGMDAPDFLASTLVASGVEPVRSGGSDAGKQYRIPKQALAGLYERALAVFGAADVRVTDSSS